MRVDPGLTSTTAQRMALLFLRVATGGLLIWVGLNKAVKGSAPFQIKRNFDLSDTADFLLGTGIGGAQVLIGVLCVIGLWRRVVLPMQALVHGVTAASVWWAIVDPYRWYISGVDRIVFNSHVFYPTIITFAACILLIAFRPQDRFALDSLRRKRQL